MLQSFTATDSTFRLKEFRELPEKKVGAEQHHRKMFSESSMNFN
jgi:hypothetical protein